MNVDPRLGKNYAVDGQTIFANRGRTQGTRSMLEMHLSRFVRGQARTCDEFY